MQRATRIALLALFNFSLAAGHSTVSAQQNPQSGAPSSRPPQAQVIHMPAQIEAGQIPAEPVPADARKPDQILRVGHKGTVQALAFSPDGQWLASGGDDNTIILWNVAAAREAFRFEMDKKAIAPGSFNKGTVTSLAFNITGTRLASANVAGVIRVWNLRTRKMLFSLGPHRVHYYGGWVSYSTDGKSLIVAVEKRVKDATQTAIGFYDAETGRIQRTIPTKWSFIPAVVPTKDGGLIVAGTLGTDDDVDPSGSVEILNLLSGEVQKSYPVFASAISPDGRWMSSFDNGGIPYPVL